MLFSFSLKSLKYFLSKFSGKVADITRVSTPSEYHLQRLSEYHSQRLQAARLGKFLFLPFLIFGLPIPLILILHIHLSRSSTLLLSGKIPSEGFYKWTFLPKVFFIKACKGLVLVSFIYLFLYLLANLPP